VIWFNLFNKYFSKDWEFPGSRDRDASSDSKVKFNILVRELRQAFDDETIRINKTNRLLLTAAVAADPKKVDQGYIVQEFCK
jgi:GH18 family chitinase